VFELNLVGNVDFVFVQPPQPASTAPARHHTSFWASLTMSGRLRAPVITPANELIDLATKISIRAASDQVDIFYTVPMLPRPWFLLFKKQGI
jgi:hypothetical protein